MCSNESYCLSNGVGVTYVHMNFTSQFLNSKLAWFIMLFTFVIRLITYMIMKRYKRTHSCYIILYMDCVVSYHQLN